MTDQPVLPAEGIYSDVERVFIENSPPRMWPDNQNSNFGQIRKVICDIFQECVDEINHLSDESYIPTASEYLSVWEDIVRVPIAPSGKTDIQRRAIILPRLQYGPFTKARVRQIIEGFIEATFGPAISFTPAGVDLPAGGVPLYSGAFSLVGSYRVYYDPRVFAYAVWLKSSTTPDIASLTKELLRVTPAGIAVTIDNTHADVLDYFRLMRNWQPNGYWRLGANLNDSSGYGATLTANGGVAAGSLASPGLLHVNVAGGDGAVLLNGTTQYLSIAAPPAQLQAGGMYEWGVEALIKTATANRYIIDKARGSSLSSYALFLDAAGHVVFRVGNQISGSKDVVSSVVVTDNVAHHVAGKYDALHGIMKIFVDGIVRGTLVVTDPIYSDADNAFQIGAHLGASFFSGNIDEVAVFNYAPTDAAIADRASTMLDVATY